ncbi:MULTISPECIES: OadG family protein [Arcobacter]|uniref:Probable oxaloacetate decarboxylase gamma chain n=1 Tax=Arcobacter defluvii TaxID=873191 RepID=A0AAE7BDS6_9BACT|nr:MULTISPECIES: OadG family protein [Arcobacter]QKF77610.1 oxaloacetate decarboxylase, gamma subunit [Arcobacter defluvii]BAK73427.1 oxaloacetate decarboxylase gamma subunit [Arcobacter sp. L]
MEVNLIAESVKFMFLGMGVVFAFLIIMILVLKAQGIILTRFFPQEEKKVVNTTPIKNSTNTETAKIAAIVAAVQHHKNLKG